MYEGVDRKYAKIQRQSHMENENNKNMNVPFV